MAHPTKENKPTKTALFPEHKVRSRLKSLRGYDSNSQKQVQMKPSSSKAILTDSDNVHHRKSYKKPLRSSNSLGYRIIISGTTNRSWIDSDVSTDTKRLHFGSQGQHINTRLSFAEDLAMPRRGASVRKKAAPPAVSQISDPSPSDQNHALDASHSNGETNEERQARLNAQLGMPTSSSAGFSQLEIPQPPRKKVRFDSDFPNESSSRRAGTGDRAGDSASTSQPIAQSSDAHVSTGQPLSTASDVNESPLPLPIDLSGSYNDLATLLGNISLTEITFAPDTDTVLSAAMPKTLTTICNNMKVFDPYNRADSAMCFFYYDPGFYPYKRVRRMKRPVVNHRTRNEPDPMLFMVPLTTTEDPHPQKICQKLQKFRKSKPQYRHKGKCGYINHNRPFDKHLDERKASFLKCINPDDEESVKHAESVLAPKKPVKKAPPKPRPQVSSSSNDDWEEYPTYDYHGEREFLRELCESGVFCVKSKLIDEDSDIVIAPCRCKKCVARQHSAEADNVEETEARVEAEESHVEAEEDAAMEQEVLEQEDVVMQEAGVQEQEIVVEQESGVQEQEIVVEQESGVQEQEIVVEQEQSSEDLPEQPFIRSCRFISAPGYVIDKSRWHTIVDYGMPFDVGFNTEDDLLSEELSADSTNSENDPEVAEDSTHSEDEPEVAEDDTHPENEPEVAEDDLHPGNEPEVIVIDSQESSGDEAQESSGDEAQESSGDEAQESSDKDDTRPENELESFVDWRFDDVNEPEVVEEPSANDLQESSADNSEESSVDDAHSENEMEVTENDLLESSDDDTHPENESEVAEEDSQDPYDEASSSIEELMQYFNVITATFVRNKSIEMFESEKKMHLSPPPRKYYSPPPRKYYSPPPRKRFSPPPQKHVSLPPQKHVSLPPLKHVAPRAPPNPWFNPFVSYFAERAAQRKALAAANDPSPRKKVSFDPSQISVQSPVQSPSQRASSVSPANATSPARVSSVTTVDVETPVGSPVQTRSQRAASMVPPDANSATRSSSVTHANTERNMNMTTPKKNVSQYTPQGSFATRRQTRSQRSTSIAPSNADSQLQYETFSAYDAESTETYPAEPMEVDDEGAESYASATRYDSQEEERDTSLTPYDAAASLPIEVITLDSSGESANEEPTRTRFQRAASVVRLDANSATRSSSLMSATGRSPRKRTSLGASQIPVGSPVQTRSQPTSMALLDANSATRSSIVAPATGPSPRKKVSFASPQSPDRSPLPLRSQRATTVGPTFAATASPKKLSRYTPRGPFVSRMETRSQRAASLVSPDANSATRSSSVTPAAGRSPRKKSSLNTPQTPVGSPVRTRAQRAASIVPPDASSATRSSSLNPATGRSPRKRASLGASQTPVRSPVQTRSQRAASMALLDANSATRSSSLNRATGRSPRKRTSLAASQIPVGSPVQTRAQRAASMAPLNANSATRSTSVTPATGRSPRKGASLAASQIPVGSPVQTRAQRAASIISPDANSATRSSSLNLATGRSPRKRTSLGASQIPVGSPVQTRAQRAASMAPLDANSATRSSSLNPATGRSPRKRTSLGASQIPVGSPVQTRAQRAALIISPDANSATRSSSMTAVTGRSPRKRTSLGASQIPVGSPVQTRAQRAASMAPLDANSATCSSSLNPATGRSPRKRTSLGASQNPVGSPVQTRAASMAPLDAAASLPIEVITLHSPAESADEGLTQRSDSVVILDANSAARSSLNLATGRSPRKKASLGASQIPVEAPVQTRSQRATTVELSNATSAARSSSMTATTGRSPRKRASWGASQIPVGSPVQTRAQPAASMVPLDAAALLPIEVITLHSSADEGSTQRSDSVVILDENSAARSSLNPATGRSPRKRASLGASQIPVEAPVQTRSQRAASMVPPDANSATRSSSVIHANTERNMNVAMPNNNVSQYTPQGSFATRMQTWSQNGSSIAPSEADSLLQYETFSAYDAESTETYPAEPMEVDDQGAESYASATRYDSQEEERDTSLSPYNAGPSSPIEVITLGDSDESPIADSISDTDFAELMGINERMMEVDEDVEDFDKEVEDFDEDVEDFGEDVEDFDEDVEDFDEEDEDFDETGWETTEEWFEPSTEHLDFELEMYDKFNHALFPDEGTSDDEGEDEDEDEIAAEDESAEDEPGEVDDNAEYEDVDEVEAECENASEYEPGYVNDNAEAEDEVEAESENSSEEESAEDEFADVNAAANAIDVITIEDSDNEIIVDNNAGNEVTVDYVADQEIAVEDYIAVESDSDDEDDTDIEGDADDECDADDEDVADDECVADDEEAEEETDDDSDGYNVPEGVDPEMYKIIKKTEDHMVSASKRILELQKPPKELTELILVFMCQGENNGGHFDRTIMDKEVFCIYMNALYMLRQNLPPRIDEPLTTITHYDVNFVPTFCQEKPIHNSFQRFQKVFGYLSESCFSMDLVDVAFYEKHCKHDPNIGYFGFSGTIMLLEHAFSQFMFNEVLRRFATADSERLAVPERIPLAEIPVPIDVNSDELSDHTQSSPEGGNESDQATNSSRRTLNATRRFKRQATDDMFDETNHPEVEGHRSRAWGLETYEKYVEYNSRKRRAHSVARISVKRIAGNPREKLNCHVCYDIVSPFGNEIEQTTCEGCQIRVHPSCYDPAKPAASPSFLCFLCAKDAPPKKTDENEESEIEEPNTPDPHWEISGKATLNEPKKPTKKTRRETAEDSTENSSQETDDGDAEEPTENASKKAEDEAKVEGKKKEQPPCRLCPLKDGPMRDYGFFYKQVHSTCFNYTRKAHHKEFDVRYNGLHVLTNCEVCQQSHGHTTQCGNGNCNVVFHAYCAIRADYSKFKTPRAKNIAKTSIRCFLHSLEAGKIPKVAPVRPNCYTLTDFMHKIPLRLPKILDKVVNYWYCKRLVHQKAFEPILPLPPRQTLIKNGLSTETRLSAAPKKGRVIRYATSTRTYRDWDSEDSDIENAIVPDGGLKRKKFDLGIRDDYIHRLFQPAFFTHSKYEHASDRNMEGDDDSPPEESPSPSSSK